MQAFHRQLPDYFPSPLAEVPFLATELRAGRVFVKDESSRPGLAAFRALGTVAGYAILVRHTPTPPPALLAVEPDTAACALAAGTSGVVVLPSTEGAPARRSRVPAP